MRSGPASMSSELLPDARETARRRRRSRNGWTYLGRRLLGALGVLAGVVLVTFLLLHLIPGDPAQSMLGNRATPAGRGRAARTVGP